MNFKIRVAENIGDDSIYTFGCPGTVLEVYNGTLEDIEGYVWCGEFKTPDDIHKYFNKSPLDNRFETIFELVEEAP
jgi:hypothetical protein